MPESGAPEIDIMISLGVFNLDYIQLYKILPSKLINDKNIFIDLIKVMKRGISSFCKCQSGFLLNYQLYWFHPETIVHPYVRDIFFFCSIFYSRYWKSATQLELLDIFQVRLGDGSRLVLKLNTVHTVAQIKQEIMAR